MLGLGTSLNRGGFISAAESLLLDEYSGAAAAYSLRKLSNTYSGNAVKVRRASDNAELDIAFSGGGLDTSAIATHCGSSDGFVSVWYDQSSNSNNASQSTAANQPKIYDGTTGVETENGKPCVHFNVDHLISSAWMTQLAPMSFTLVQTPNSSARELVIGVDTSTPYTTAYHNWSSSGGSGFLSPRLASFPANSVSTSLMTEDVLNLVSSYASTTAVNFYTNGSISAESPISHSNTSAADGVITIGSPTTYNPIRSSKISEVVFWLADQSSNRTNIESNINTFYSIF
tara:strand:- start:370 stop:1230 length:861 start_codon:yes stop_codon:yes gene_type:complete